MELVGKTIWQGQKNRVNPHNTLLIQRNKAIPIRLKDVCNPTVLPHQTKSQRNKALPIGLKDVYNSAVLPQNQGNKQIPPLPEICLPTFLSIFLSNLCHYVCILTSFILQFKLFNRYITLCVDLSCILLHSSSNWIYYSLHSIMC